MDSAAARVPSHLREFVVEQDYARYTAIDHAVWRFVLLQMHSRLVDTAHPAYRDGLTATGISVERIPSVAEMNEKLGRFGWGAVCVDGFIPPRAFQELQACAILPIAADVRSREHLVYTPAPDIIHEAAGHAPILPDPVFSPYVRKIGDLGRHAFTLPAESAVFDAIHELSEVKESLRASEEDVARAEAGLRDALAGASQPSEATRLSRLYWWTAEYGLVGRVSDYKIYGAGLLSSLGESQSCHDPAVRKIVLDERCMDVAYDITKPQPQLFVVPRFEALHDVLDRAARTMAVARGGAYALDCAVRSREVATVVFEGGACVIGILADWGPGPDGRPAWLAFEGHAAYAWGAGGAASAGAPSSGRSGALSSGQGGASSFGHGDEPLAAASRPAESLVVLTGRLEGGARLDDATDADIASWRDAATGRHRVRFASGASVEGRLERTTRRTDGRVATIEWRDALIELSGAPSRRVPSYRMLAASSVATAHAGAADPRFHSDTAFSSKRVPAPSVAPPAGDAAEVLALYERAEGAFRTSPAAVASVFPAVHAALKRQHPREWLLRWNMLESLLKARADSPLADSLRGELEKLEVAFDHREPIASGLRYLQRR